MNACSSGLIFLRMNERRRQVLSVFCIFYFFFQVVKSYLEVIDEKATVTRLVFFQDYKRQAGPG